MVALICQLPYFVNCDARAVSTPNADVDSFSAYVG